MQIAGWPPTVASGGPAAEKQPPGAQARGWKQRFGLGISFRAFPAPGCRPAQESQFTRTSFQRGKMARSSALSASVHPSPAVDCPDPAGGSARLCSSPSLAGHGNTFRRHLAPAPGP